MTKLPSKMQKYLYTNAKDEKINLKNILKIIIEKFGVAEDFL